MNSKNLALIAVAVAAALLFLGFLIQAGKVSSNVKQAGYGQEFTLALGESASVGGKVLKFMRIAEDSRCPADVMCVWQGQAVAEVQYYGNSGKRLLNLTLLSGNPALATLKVDGVGITLVQVQPYPGTVPEIKAADYRATFVIRQE